MIIHCSASNIHGYGFQSIKRDHINRGFDDIGYHFGIDWNAKIEILRPIDIIGAHCRGYNTGSIGICLLGLDLFYDNQYKTLAKLCHTLICCFDIELKDIYGHRDFTDKKTCPNFDVEWFKKRYMNGV